MINALVFGDDWGRGTTKGVSQFLQRNNVAVHTTDPWGSLDANLPPLDVCICTGINVSGQGPDTERWLDEQILARNIPLVPIDTDFCLGRAVGQRATLRFEEGAIVEEMRAAGDTTPQSFQRLLEFVTTRKKENG